jgi:hypothetical protein
MRNSLSCSLAGALVLAAAAAAPSFAQANDSAYVQVFDDCVQREEGRDFFSDCAAHGDWMVYVSAGEHHADLAYSQRGQGDQWQAAPPRKNLPFVDLGDVMEWRLDGAGEAFATIYRTSYEGYSVEGDGVGAARQSFLTVTALRPGAEIEACPVAHVEASQQPDANQIARDAADNLAPGWQCGVDEVIVFDLNSEMDVQAVAARRSAQD